MSKSPRGQLPAALVFISFIGSGCVGDNSDPTAPLAARLIQRAPASTLLDGYDLGFTYYDCIHDLTYDDDADGLNNTCESELASAFNPELVVHYDDDVTRETAVAVRHASGTVFIIYMLAYHRDLGTINVSGINPFNLGPHSGDSEFIVVMASESGGRWYLDSAFLSAHYKVKWWWWSFDESDTYQYSSLSYADQYRGRPKVWVAREKHANYPSYSACNTTHDECTSPSFTWDALTYANRNVGNASTQLIDSIASLTPSYYTGIEAFWTETGRFNGWFGSEWGSPPRSYRKILGEWGFLGGYTPVTVSVDLIGPGYVQPNANCYWNASVSGGTSPYEYMWFRGDTLVDTSDTYQANTGTQDFILSVFVYDRYGYEGQDYLAVGLNEEYDGCVER